VRNVSEAGLLIKDGCVGVAVAAGFAVTLMRTPLFPMVVIGGTCCGILRRVAGGVVAGNGAVVSQLFDKMSAEKQGVSGKQEKEKKERGEVSLPGA